MNGIRKSLKMKSWKEEKVNFVPSRLHFDGLSACFGNWRLGFWGMELLGNGKEKTYVSFTCGDQLRSYSISAMSS